MERAGGRGLEREKVKGIHLAGSPLAEDLVLLLLLVLALSLRKKRDPHPGESSKAQAKRANGSVQKDKDAKAVKNNASAAKRQGGINKAAAVQLRKEREANANHPPCKTQQKVLRPRPEPPATKEQPAAPDGHVDPVSPGPGSSDDYDPKAQEDDAKELDPSEDDMDPKPVHPKTQNKLAKGSTRQEEGFYLWATPPPPKKTKAAAIGGLHDEWKRGRTPSSSGVSHRSQSAGSAMSVDLQSDGDMMGLPPASEYNDSSEGIGGFKSDEDDGDEKKWAADHNDKKVGRQIAAGNAELENLTKLNSLAGIVNTEAAGLVPLHRAKSGGIKKSAINLTHLPATIQSLFNSKYKPTLLQWAAMLPAWEGIESWADIADIWLKTFPEHPLKDNDDLQAIVVKLSEAKLNSWCHAFATAALESLMQLLDAWDLDSPVDCAEAVEWLLKRLDDGTRIFYWWKYYADPVEGADPDAELEVKPKAAYPSGVTSRSSLPDKTVPEGPLVYAIQAAQRALNYTKTGKFVLHSQRLGEFSKTNWGDRTGLQGGKLVPINTTSDLASLVQTLTDAQWSKIVDSTLAAARPSCRTSKAVEVIDVDDGVPITATYNIIDHNDE
ncbi:hypothetical protein DFH07DRAFT_772219 [Mycena maculata]|uniref:Uncharacterized protein n=1 Tax=Mycena maculata TaxID=230809 RepID=A0AAD7NG18_9AGAR|nr:hypothetical protein DFH07DRAFT_772219 [Mycena maculata]